MLCARILRSKVFSTRVGGQPVTSECLVSMNDRKAFLDRLSKDVVDLCSRISPSQEQIQEKDLFLARLQQSVGGVLDNAVVAPFGSAVNGFWSPSSDIDVCIQASGCRTRAAQIEALRKVASCLHSISSHYIEPRFTARVPIIHWAPRRTGYLACDISINNTLAVVNSRLVGAYSAIDPRMVQLGMVIKHWANARGINDRSRGTLSSFSLLLMLIHFLQRRSPPILPSLQDMAIASNQPLSYCLGSDVRYVDDPVMIQQELARLTSMAGSSNRESVGELLVEFFRYYGFTYKNGIIGIRDLRPFHAIDVTTESPVYLVVDNPFEVGKDVANVDRNQHSRVRQELRRAFTLLDSGSRLDELSASLPLNSPSVNYSNIPTDPPLMSLGASVAAKKPRNSRSR